MVRSYLQSSQGLKFPATPVRGSTASHAYLEAAAVLVGFHLKALCRKGQIIEVCVKILLLCSQNETLCPARAHTHTTPKQQRHFRGLTRDGVSKGCFPVKG